MGQPFHRNVSASSDEFGLFELTTTGWAELDAIEARHSIAVTLPTASTPVLAEQHLPSLSVKPCLPGDVPFSSQYSEIFDVALDLTTLTADDLRHLDETVEV